MHLDKLVLPFAVVLLYFLFQLTSIFWIISLDGECLHVNWLHSFPRLSPFWGFVISISLLLLLGTFSGLQKVRRGKQKISELIFYSVFIAILSMWLVGMNHMWKTFEYEKGVIDKIDYYPQELLDRVYSGRDVSSSCKLEGE